MASKSSRSKKESYDVRKDIATLIEAKEGKEFVELWRFLVISALQADDGTLKDSNGVEGYAWSPDAYKEHHGNKLSARFGTVGAALGRLVFTGHANYRARAAFSHAVYLATVESDYDTVDRIEALWDKENEKEEVVPVKVKQPGVIERVVRWFRHLFGRTVEYDRL
jgi:hypothetical protein